jgi:hypothetical protein
MFTSDNFQCPGAVLDLAWHPDGMSLYAACTDGTVYGIFFDVGDVHVRFRALRLILFYVSPMPTMLLYIAFEVLSIHACGRRGARRVVLL